MHTDYNLLFIKSLQCIIYPWPAKPIYFNDDDTVR